MSAKHGLFKRRTGLRVVAASLAAAFLMQEVALAAAEFAAPPPVAVPAGPPFPELNPPASVATVEDSYRAPHSSKTLILFQDAHVNESAQLNLARFVEWAARSGAVRWVFLEGGTGDDSLSYLRETASPRARERAAREFMAKGQLQGADYADLVSSEDIRLWGVEDKALYSESVELYRSLKSEAPRVEGFLDAVDRAVKSLKARIFRPSLAAFDERRSAFVSGALPLTDYLETLLAAAGSAGMEPSAYPALASLRSIRQAESEIDFKKAGDERAAAIASLDAEAREKLLQAALRPSPSRLDARDRANEQAFYAVLEEELGDRRPYPNLFKYADYLKSASGFDAAAVVDERRRMEDALFDALAASPDERRLVEIALAQETLREIFSLRVGPEEFAGIGEGPRAADAARTAGYLNRKLLDLGGSAGDAVFLEPAFAPALEKAKRFYRLTALRDEAFLAAALAKMDETGESAAVLVAGGYHAPNLKKRLREQGVSYVSVVPRVLAETNYAKYESVLLSQAVTAGAAGRFAAGTPRGLGVVPARECVIAPQSGEPFAVVDRLRERLEADAGAAFSTAASRLAGKSLPPPLERVREFETFPYDPRNSGASERLAEEARFLEGLGLAAVPVYRFVEHSEDDVAIVRRDLKSLEQVARFVFLELVKNWEHVKPGPGTSFRHAIRKIPREDGFDVEVVVEDTGQGLDFDNASEAYLTAVAPGRDTVEEQGLGLFITRQLMQAVGAGTLEVHTGGEITTVSLGRYEKKKAPARAGTRFRAVFPVDAAAKKLLATPVRVLPPDGARLATRRQLYPDFLASRESAFLRRRADELLVGGFFGWKGEQRRILLEELFFSATRGLGPLAPMEARLKYVERTVPAITGPGFLPRAAAVFRLANRNALIASAGRGAWKAPFVYAGTFAVNFASYWRFAFYVLGLAVIQNIPTAPFLGTIRVFLPAALTPAQFRFVAAHELAHTRGTVAGADAYATLRTLETREDLNEDLGPHLAKLMLKTVVILAAYTGALFAVALSSRALVFPALSVWTAAFISRALRSVLQEVGMPKGSEWKQEDFELIVRKGRLWALGSGDETPPERWHGMGAEGETEENRNDAWKFAAFALGASFGDFDAAYEAILLSLDDRYELIYEDPLNLRDRRLIRLDEALRTLRSRRSSRRYGPGNTAFNQWVQPKKTLRVNSSDGEVWVAAGYAAFRVTTGEKGVSVSLWSRDRVRRFTAEMSFPPGTVRVGSDPSADLFSNDRSLDPLHFSVRLDPASEGHRFQVINHTTAKGISVFWDRSQGKPSGARLAGPGETIRPAGTDDIETILDIWETEFKPRIPSSPSRIAFRTFLESRIAGTLYPSRVLVAEEEGRIVAYSIASANVSLRIGTVSQVAVLRDFRGRGIATRLIGEGIAWLETQSGIGEIWASDESENQVSSRILLGLGFQEKTPGVFFREIPGGARLAGTPSGPADVRLPEAFSARLSVFFAAIGLSRSPELSAARRLPVVISEPGADESLAAFDLELSGRTLSARADGLEPVVVTDVKSAPEPAPPDGAPQLSIADLRLMEDELDSAVHERLRAIHERGGPRVKIVTLDVDAFPEGSFESKVEAFIDEFGKARETYGKNALLRFASQSGDAARAARAAGSEAALRLAKEGALLEGALSPELEQAVKDGAAVGISLAAVTSASATGPAFGAKDRRVPLRPMQDGDVPAVRAMLELAFAVGEADLSSPGDLDAIRSAWTALSKSRLETEDLLSILLNKASLETVLRHALQPLAPVDWNVAVRYLKFRLQVDRSA